jgi:hypothetical protein
MERNSNSSYTQKRSRDRCENYRGIALGNAAYRMLSNIILGNITNHKLKKLWGTIGMDLEMDDL